MIPYSAGDVVLVQFPFTDLQSSKKRPALILNPQEFSKQHNDIVVLAMSSQDPNDSTLLLAFWQSAGLPKPTWIKPLVGTLSSKLIVKRIGILAKSDYAVVTHALKCLVVKEFW